MARLKDKYLKEVLPQLAKQLGRNNPMSLPRITKIVVNSPSKMANVLRIV